MEYVEHVCSEKLPSPFSNLLDSSPLMKAAISGNCKIKARNEKKAEHMTPHDLSWSTLELSHLSAHIVSDHLLDNHVGQRLKVLHKLLVLLLSGLLLHEELKERSFLPADPSHICSLLSHPQQQTQQISHACKKENRGWWKMSVREKEKKKKKTSPPNILR